MCEDHLHSITRGQYSVGTIPWIIERLQLVCLQRTIASGSHRRQRDFVVLEGYCVIRDYGSTRLSKSTRENQTPFRFRGSTQIAEQSLHFIVHHNIATTPQAACSHPLGGGLGDGGDNLLAVLVVTDARRGSAVAATLTRADTRPSMSVSDCSHMQYSSHRSVAIGLDQY
jgi:hypothetical protein